jgi:L-seryl-tRNA(Ser) seleniumtransferase
MLKDVGTANRTTAADYEAAASTRAAMLLKIASDEYRIVGDTTATQLEELVALARDRELILVSAVGAAPLIDPPAPIQWPQRSVRTILSAGADLVVLRGDGLVGGPACGILVGQQNVIQRIVNHPLFAAWQLDPLRGAALVGTLQCYEYAPQRPDALPVWQILTTPVENLHNRAERIAPQIANAPGIASAAAIETHSPIAAALLDAGGWPSYGVALSPSNGDIRGLDKRLTNGAEPVHGRVEGDRLVLDLRTVFPRQDRSLVDALLGRTEPNEAAEPSAD